MVEGGLGPAHRLDPDPSQAASSMPGIASPPRLQPHTALTAVPGTLTSLLVPALIGPFLDL